MTVILANTRTPSETKPPRMEPLARLPVFLALEGKRAVVAGGTPARRLEGRTAFGGRRRGRGLMRRSLARSCWRSRPTRRRVRSSSTAAPGRLTTFAAPPSLSGRAKPTMRRRTLPPPARAAGVPVNVIDKPKFCDFSFGAIVNRSPLVIGISTDGAAPVFGQAIRAKLEALIPRGFAHWAEAARRWRSEVKTSGLSFNARRRFWQIFTAHAVGNPNHEPEAADYDRLLTAARADSESADKGSVTLVGAGPGDPELLTLRAVRALQSADIILFDDLVSPEILEFARREAKKMQVGKTGHGPSCKQDEINALMVGLAQRWPSRGAAQGWRPHDLRPRRRRDRRLPQSRCRH